MILFSKKEISIGESIKVLLELILCSILGGIPFYVLKRINVIGESLMLALSALVGSVIFIFVFQRFKISELKCFFKQGIPLYMYFVLVLLSLAMNIVIDPLPHYLAIPDWYKEEFDTLFENKLLFFLIVIVLAPVVEEIVMRGIILGGLLEKYSSEWIALLVSTLIFSIIHFNPAQSVGALFLGLLCGWAYLKLKNLIAPIIVHSISNAFGWYLMANPIITNKNSIFELFLNTTHYFTAIIAGIVILIACIYIIRVWGRRSNLSVQ